VLITARKELHSDGPTKNRRRQGRGHGLLDRFCCPYGSTLPETELMDVQGIPDA
jgi:hypothetical protein